MAMEQPLFKIAGLRAGGDLSSDQFKCVKKNTTLDQVVRCTVDGEVVLGILQNKPDAAGKSAEVMAAGVSKVVAGGTLAVGDFWGTDGNGKAVTKQDTNTGADTGDFIMGRVLEGGALDDLITVTVGLITFRDESA